MKAIKTIIIALATLLLAWALPWCYGFLFSSPHESPLTLYSPVTHDFATFSFEGRDDVAGYDLAGNAYTERQFDSIMPTVYARQLAQEGRLPATIDGREVSVQSIEQSNFVFRALPNEKNRPRIGLYQLLNAASCHSGLGMPDDLFRTTDEGIEFVSMEHNGILPRKSERYTALLKDNGFAFPARCIAGNATTHKPYDNGYLLIDSNGKAFQMKQLCHGRPFVRRVASPDSLRFVQAYVTEFPDRRFIGFLADSQGIFYAIDARDYTLCRLPLAPTNLDEERLIVVGDMFYWTAIVDCGNREHLTAIDAQTLAVVAEHDFDFPDASWQRTRRWVFPFRLVFSSPNDRFMAPHLRDVSAYALLLNALCALSYLLLRRRNPNRCTVWLRSAGILLLGLFLFLPLLAADRE